MKKILLLHSLLTLPVVMLFWAVVYPDTLRWTEAMSFFSTLPDFMALQVRYPSEWLKYAGSFIAQFYHSPLTGALLQALMVWVVMICADVIVMRIAGRVRLMWIAFVPVAVMTALQCSYHDLSGSLAWCLIAFAVMVVAVVFTRRRNRIAGDTKIAAWRIVLLPALLLFIGMGVSWSQRENRVRERIYRVERLADEQQWDEILKTVRPEVSAADPVRRRYALLALTCRGELADKLFAYGAASPDDLFFPHSTDVVGCNFNALLARELGLDNEVVHQMFQLNSLAPLGYSFRSMRRITDACIRQGNTSLADKYMRILLHSSCHKNWVRSRVDNLLRVMADTLDRQDDDILVCASTEKPLLIDMASLYDAQPDNRRCADLLLCGLLTARDLDKFAMLFPTVISTSYSPTEPLPRHYEEALLLISRRDPEVLRKYRINPLRVKEFSRFVALMDADRSGEACASYPDSFWAYMYGRE